MSDLKPVDLDTLLKQQDEQPEERKPVLRDFIDNYAKPAATMAVAAPAAVYQKLKTWQPGVLQNTRKIE